MVFEVAARHLSFTRAAESLHVTQAAVSHQIKALEDWLGVTLFHRLGRGQGLALTEAGRHYLPRIRAAFETIRDSTATLGTRRRKVLNVATLDSFGFLWLVPRLAAFTRRHGDTDVRIIAADLDADVLEQGIADLEIRYGDGDWTGVTATRFLTESVFPVCSPAIVTGERPLERPEDLRHHTLLHDVMVIGWRDWLEAAGVTDIDAEHGPGFNHSHLVVQSAICGAGVALGRGALVADALAQGKLIKPFALSLPSRFAYYAVCSRATSSDPLVAAFQDWLVAEGATSQIEIDRLTAAPPSALRA